MRWERSDRRLRQTGSPSCATGDLTEVAVPRLPTPYVIHPSALDLGRPA
jgi:hypothetical protein